MQWVAIFVATLAGVFAYSATAQTQTDGLDAATRDNLQKLVADPVHQKAIRDESISGFLLVSACMTPPIDFMLSDNVSSYAPLKIDVDGKIQSGVLVEHGTVSGCGTQLIVNILTVKDKDANHSVFGMPGSTLADPILVHDTIGYVYRAAIRKVGECKTVRVVNTQFVEFFGEPNPQAKFQKNSGRAWREIWTLDICRQQKVDVPVEYIPDATGTTISVRAIP